MPTVQKETLEGKIYSILRREILEGRLRGGERLVQDDLAAELGTSRIPVRAALKRLEGSGLVTMDPKGAYWVAEFNAADIAEIYGLRMLLEPYAALQALPNLTEKDVRELRALNENMLATIEDGDTDLWVDLNSQFHLAIYEASSQPRLLRTIREFWFNRPMFSVIKTREQLMQAAAEHEAIIAAIEGKDGARLEELVRAHIRAAGTRWSDYLATRMTKADRAQA